MMIVRYSALSTSDETGELSSLETMLSSRKFSRNKDVKKLSRTSQYIYIIAVMSIELVALYLNVLSPSKNVLITISSR